MRINRRRRGSVTVEGLMILPVALVVILMGRFLLEASLNRQETSVYARGAAISAAIAGRSSACRFEDHPFEGRASVDQSANVRCSRRNAERGLSAEDPIWDALEDAAAPWDEILRDVRPSTGPRDMISTAEVTMTMTAPAYLADQAPALAEEQHLAPERRYWGHGEDDYAEGHDRVIWEELCTEASWQMFPNVFPSRGTERC
ncbi:MAG: hypothetical protein AAFN09_01035 [Pseudomonadota bacterium]